MANRISTRLEDMRVSVAQGMFATEQSVEEPEVEEPTETEVEVQDTADTPVEEPTETEAE
jgi:hypothetical protein